MNKIIADSGELNRIMKVLSRCMDKKISTRSNIQILHENDKLTIRAANGTFLGEMSMKVPGGDGEAFCVDGDMFARVVGMCNKDIEILTDGKNCALKGIGRTRIPIVNAKVKTPDKLKGDSVTVKAEHFKNAYSLVSYAIAQDQSRPLLTGVLVETEEKTMRFVACDGFQIAVESVPCSGKKTGSMIIPGAFMDLISSAIMPGDELELITNGKIIQARTKDMTIQCALMIGEYVDYKCLIPQTFATETKICTDDLMDALKSSSVVNNKLNTVKVAVRTDELIVTNNSPMADFEAKIPCVTQGDGGMIAFNERYLMNTVSVLKAEESVIKFNTATSPVLIQCKESDGIHICMPVRLHEVVDGQE